MGPKWENRLKMQMPPHRPNSIQISPRVAVALRRRRRRRRHRFLVLHLSNAAELMNRNGNADLYLMDTAAITKVTATKKVSTTVTASTRHI